MQAERGLTLVEVLASLLIFTIIIGGIYLLLEHGTRAWFETNEQTQVRNQANVVMAYIQKSVNQIKTPSSEERAVNVSVNRLTINDTKENVDGLVYEFRLDPTNGSITRMYRGTSSTPVESAITSRDINFVGSSFTLSGDRVLVHLQLEGARGYRYQLDSSIRYLLK